jgi:hypothetical protein
LGWDRTGLVQAAIGCLIGRRLSVLSEEQAGTCRALLRICGDYRLVAEYLRAWADGDTRVVDACERLAAERPGARQGQMRYEVGRLRYGTREGADVAWRGSPADVLADDSQGTIAYVAPAVREQFTVLLGELGTSLSAFIEGQHEIPGPNARVRQGIVKTWFLPDGTQVASKRVNPMKPDRFEREVNCHREVEARLSRDGVPTRLAPPESGRVRDLAAVPVYAVIRDGPSGVVYSVSRWVQGVPLESILLGLSNGPERVRLVRDYRAVMDALLDRGIIWGDLSPRNVLLMSEAGRDTYYILDFEKTTVIDGPVSESDRTVYCRGQVGVEELGVLCSQDEVEGCLSGYFRPVDWDLTSEQPLPFPPRPEVAEVLRGRGITSPSVGVYNRTDLEILDVRLPDREPGSGRVRYPGQVNFRVEHYLSCAGRQDAGDKERRVTEVLIAARRHDCFDEAIEIIAHAVDAVEREFVVSEFRELLQGRLTGGLISPPEELISRLAAVIDTMYDARSDRSKFYAVC